MRLCVLVHYTVAMADLSERKRVWKKIEEKEAELKQVMEKLEAVQAELKEELKKPTAEQIARLLDNLETDKAILSKQWASLDAELQKFQDLLAAGGVCLFAS